ncbi:M13 family metallopeptidase [Halioxenophilus aromaticivorans]|uniref:M13 family metallopeptidase n=1 Tax=Halioxenophilus aromaticivorans TaxID=1306992 RepID=A0AAV3U3A9_9ALTE
MSLSRWATPTRIALCTALISLSACQMPTPESTSVPSQSEKISGVTLETFDNTTRPQDDLFQFVNGTWLETTEIPADRSSYGSFYVLREEATANVRTILEDLINDDSKHPADVEKAKALYQTFMDEAAIEQAGASPYQALASEIDGIDSQQALMQFLGKSWMVSGLAPVALFVSPDKKNPDQYTVYFYQAGLSLPDRDYYFDSTDHGQEVLAAFEEHIEKMLQLVGASDTQATAEDILAFEAELAEGHWPRVDLRDAVKTYNPITAEDLIGQNSNTPWSEFLSAAQIADQPQLIIGQPSFMLHLNEMLAEIPLDQWRTYLKWRALTYLAPYLNEALATEDFNFYSKTLYGTQEQRARWKRGIAFTDQIAGEAVGKLYVEKHFPPEAKARMTTLVENLREAYRESILALDWMSEDTKAQAINKLEKFVAKIGYPDEWKDYSQLQVSTTSLVDNLLYGEQFQYQQQIDKLGKPIDRNEWFMTPQTVNAYYNPLMNEIVFPAAILQPPFFNLEADDAINYGAIGGVIGHEMGHGFDDQGSRYNGDGKLENWWQPTDSQAFTQRTQTLVEQYDGYQPLPEQHVNGQLTLGENIGDLGGLTIAYKAYQLSLQGKPSPVIDGFTGEQRLFIGWAQAFASKYTDENLRNRLKTDPHSPARYRVNGVVRNMPEFVDAFGVTESDQLYLPPAQRVKIW